MDLIPSQKKFNRARIMKELVEIAFLDLLKKIAVFSTRFDMYDWWSYQVNK